MSNPSIFHHLPGLSLQSLDPTLSLWSLSIFLPFYFIFQISSFTILVPHAWTLGINSNSCLLISSLLYAIEKISFPTAFTEYYMKLQWDKCYYVYDFWKTKLEHILGDLGFGKEVCSTCGFITWWFF